MEMLKDKISYLKSERGKRVLKFSLLLGVVFAILAGGVYMYINHVNKLSYQKYIKAQDLYLQVIGGQGEEEKVENLKEAAELFKQAASNRFWSGSKQEALFYLADCVYRLGNFEESIKVLKKFRENYSSSYFSPWVQLKLALIYEEKGDYHQAINLYEKVGEKYAQSPVAPEAFLGQARCQELLNNQEKALKAYQTLISKYPLSPQARMAEEKIQHFSQKKG